MYHSIDHCRICSGTDLTVVLDLGEMALTGVFPKSESIEVAAAPLVLVQCQECGLVQLRESFDLNLLYGETYGYRSGLNRSMVRHLEDTVGGIEAFIPDLGAGDLVVDIGSNDGTLLGCYRTGGLRRVGIDPLGTKFSRYYRPGIELVPEFFSADALRKCVGDQKAKVVTSIAMFYDLERPIDFARQVAEALDDQGIWVLEQSYLTSMLSANSYDTICHEHLEYYGVKQIAFLVEQCGLKIVGLDFNDSNGGSFRVTVAKAASRWRAVEDMVQKAIARELQLGLGTAAPFIKLQTAMKVHRERLRGLLQELRAQGKTVLGYGASTKGNVLLQYCSIDRTLLPAIADVNEEKFGSFTPGSRIPILSEGNAKAMAPDYFVVLPWHFRNGIVDREKQFLSDGGTLVFPLPELELVSAERLVDSNVS